MVTLRIFQKAIAVIIMFTVICVSTISLPVSASESEVIAAWDYSAIPTSYPIPATSGLFSLGAELRSFKHLSGPDYKFDGLSEFGWEKGVGTKFWQVKFSTKGYRDLKLSAQTSSSAVGPRDFKVTYSIDEGSTWKDIPGSEYQIMNYTKIGNDILYKHNLNLSLPIETNNRDILLLRFVMRTNHPAQTYYEYDYGDVAYNGTSQINNIIVSGTPIVSGISLDVTEKVIKVGETFQLTASIKPENAGNKQVEWASDNLSVAEVNESGLVAAVGGGTVIITVKTEDGGFQASCEVTVEVPVAGISLDKTNETIICGNSLQVNPKIVPEDATDKSIKWETSNPLVATVDANGLVTTINSGTAVITATTIDGSIKAQCIVTVEIPATEAKLDKSSATLNVNETLSLFATIIPENATIKSVLWTSSIPEVADVDEYGEVKALAPGTAEIIAKTVNEGIEAKCIITVIVPVTGIQFDEQYYTVKEGETQQLIVAVIPEYASKKNVIWESSDKTIATVDENGRVTGLRIGYAKITAATVDGDYKAECIVTVTEKSVTGVRINKDAITIKAGKFEFLTAHLLQGKVSVSDLVWSTDNENIAKIGQVKNNGKTVEILGISGGTTIITVTTLDGGFTATCEVTVIPSNKNNK